MAACVSLALCASCTDKEALEGYAETDVLSFGVSVSNEWNPYTGTRSKAGEMPERSAFKFENSDMWLIATSEQKMDTTLFCKPKTRAAEKTEGNFYTSFGVHAYAYKGNSWESKSEVKPYFLGEEVKESNNVWKTEPLRYWPGEQYRMHFFAYAPYNMGILDINDDNTPMLYYDVPEDVKEQEDLVVATADVVGNYNQSVPLEFKHILTAVKVKVAQGISGEVTKVALKNIAGSGSYTFGGSSWTLDTDNETSDFEIKYNDDNDPLKLDGDDDTFIADGDNTFMMIPQVLGENATLEVEFSDGKTLTGKLHGKTDWEIGHTVIYKISKTKIDYVFDVPSPDIFAGEGGTKKVDITSYKVEGNNRTPLSWRNDGYYIMDEDDKYTELDATPDWLVFPTYQTEGTDYSVQVYSQRGNGSDNTGVNKEMVSINPDEELQDIKTEVGSEFAPENLAGADGSETTANCYIVNGPGWYKFPIVYGNALKNGTANEQAYNYANHIVNHLDRQITDPWIKKNKDVTIGSAELLWQDANFVDNSSVLVDDDDKYIKFHIPAGESCVQGNAVIAVKDNEGKIAWSWHIWVTLHDPNDSFNFGNYTFFNTLLGYREAALVKYLPREVYVKLVQEESQDVEYVHISQAYLYHFVQAGNAPYYQHGRKDPFPGASLEVTRENNGKYKMKVVNDKLAGFSGKVVEDSYTLGYAIQHPNTYIGQATDNKNWYWYKDKKYGFDDKGKETGYTDLWANNNVKTVYDPCPAGYKIPSKTAIENVFNTSKANVEYVNTGIYFINNKNTSDEQRFFLQILGSRRYELPYIGLMSSSLNANIPSVESNGSTDATYLIFNPNTSNVYWTAGGSVCQGQCVLPQKEK